MSDWLANAIDRWGSEQALVFGAAGRTAGLYGPFFCIAAAVLMVLAVWLSGMVLGLEMLSPAAITIMPLYAGLVALGSSLTGAAGTYLVGVPIALGLLKLRATEWPIFLFVGVVAGFVLGWVATGSMPLAAPPVQSLEEPGEGNLKWLIQAAALVYTPVYAVLGCIALARAGFTGPIRLRQIRRTRL